MEPRLNRDQLLAILQQWNRFLKRKVHLIACGGTAMTLLGVKESTRDVDFMVPDAKERDYLLRTLQQLGYQQETQYGWQRPREDFRFDLFIGNRIHTTELFESPLAEGRNTCFAEYSRLYIGILNDYDLIVSKLIRGLPVDYADSLMLISAHKQELDIPRLLEHFEEMRLYDISEEKLKIHIQILIEKLRENDLYE